MDFNLKRWIDKSEGGEEQGTPAAPPSAKLPGFLLNSRPRESIHHSPASSALPLLVPAPTSDLSAHSSENSSTASTTKHPRMGSYFSLAQWQEFELQALIFRHMIAGVAVPPEFLYLVKKGLSSSPSLSPYYLCNPLRQYYPHNYLPALVQSGYWGRAAMDPEPGRCRRTDGKKWRCSRDVVAGQKYCERHMHRGRNRSRKPVEVPTSTAAAATTLGGGAAVKINHSVAHGMASHAVGGGTPHFSISGPSSSTDLHLNRSPSDSAAEKCPFEAQNGGPAGGVRTLRHFIDDWPRSLQAHEADPATSATALSISMPGNHPSSDFSLKLGTGGGDRPVDEVASGERGRQQLNWRATWEASRVASMGGPLAEALRSSMSTSSPTSVLHRRPRSTTVSEASYVSS